MTKKRARVIEFRGKDIDTGKWIYGRLLADDVIVPSGQEFGVCANHIEDDLIAHIVDPETIGQYTGLRDKNNVKIFEGDIVRIIEEDENVVVKWDERGAAFKTVWSRVDEGASFYENLWHDDVEVIGNIHDNPEIVIPAESKDEMLFLRLQKEARKRAAGK